jgi:hypothetical protein
MSRLASSPVTTSRAPASSAAEVLSFRKIIFDQGGSVDPKQEPDPISFEEEWFAFIKVANDLTKTDSATHDSAQGALVRLLRVIMNNYEKGETFKITLFHELRKSLGGFCEDIHMNTDDRQAKRARLEEQTMTASGATLDTTQLATRSDDEYLKELASLPIMLKGCPVGFATNVNRNTSLKFSSDYGLCQGSKYDMACLVFREDACDMTATVELKLSHRACEPYYGSLDLTEAHAPMAQALLHGTDVWHSLARRGYKEEQPQDSLSISAVVLAAKTDIGLKEHLCCMEACLMIPSRLGGDSCLRSIDASRFPHTATRDKVR